MSTPDSASRPPVLKALRARGRRSSNMTSRVTESWPPSSAVHTVSRRKEVLPTETASPTLSSASNDNNDSSLLGFMVPRTIGPLRRDHKQPVLWNNWLNVHPTRHRLHRQGRFSRQRGYCADARV